MVRTRIAPAACNHLSLRELQTALLNWLFARAKGEHQALVYGMNIAAPDPVAMVLPLPTPLGVGEDAVRFLDLRGYPKLFVDLNECFPPIMPPQARGAGGGGGGAPIKHLLQVALCHY